jgi:hypothetical protein
MFEAILGYGYAGWLLFFVLLLAWVRWSGVEQDVFSQHRWPHLE